MSITGEEKWAEVSRLNHVEIESHGEGFRKLLRVLGEYEGS